jgi:hypothetical protein
MRPNYAAALAGLGGLLAIVSIALPWYNTGPFTFDLLNAIKPPACPPGAFCELVPASPSLIVAFVCTILGGSLGITSSLLVRRKSPKISRILVFVSLIAIAIGVAVSLSDAIEREGLSIGFYTDSFSAILFMAHIVSHK